MLNIGDFARFAGVSVRMLRHYDALGLLAPTAVDPHSGYRRYDETLLPRAHQLVALKELGFTLEEVGDLLDSALTREQLRGLLDARRTQLSEQIAADRTRLAEVERRLRMMEGDTMELTFTERSLAALDVTQLTAEVTDQPQIGPVIGPLFGRLDGAAAEQGVDLQPGYAWYDMSEDGIRFGACAPGTLHGDGFERARLDAVPRAVVTTYTGPISRIAEAWQALGAHLAERSLEPAGVCREVYHAAPLDRPEEWVTELQQPVR